MSVCVCVPGTLKTEEGIISPETMTVVNHHMGDRNRTTKSPARAADTLNEEPSLQPHFPFSFKANLMPRFIYLLSRIGGIDFVRLTV